MPRNASGVYTLPSGNPVVPGTTIDAAWANDTMEDMANEITNSLSRTGAGGMLAPFRLADGTVTAPGVAWLNETNSGLYRSGAGSTWMSILGVNTIQFSTVGVTIPFGKALTAQGNASVSGTLAVTGATTLGSTLAVTGAITATGGVVGNVTGNVTAASGSSSFNDVTISGSLDMVAGSSATITGLSTPTNASDAANKGYVDSQAALKLSLTGGTMSGNIAMGGNLVTGLGAPSAGGDAANKTYVDAQVATRLPYSGGVMTGYIDMNGYDIVGLSTPSDPSMAANKAYVDSMAQGIDAKASCKVASIGNMTLSGTQVYDGVALVVGDRVLVKDQTDAPRNGIYTVASGVWPRAADANTWDELVAAYTFIEQGTNANNGYVCTVSAGGTLGTTPVTWAQFSGAGQIDAGTGMSKTGNTLNVNTASSSRIVVNADNIDLATTGVTGGTYKSVTVDAYGRVTAGTNPTTLAGYGITDAYTTTQVDAALALKLNLTGGTMSGAIAMGGNKITGLGTPTNSADATTKTYVDSADALKLNLTGGTMSGAIAMGANKITGMADPTNPQDAATKNYIDTIFGSTTSAAASASAAAASASAASTSATNAATSATNAATSASNAATTYTTFNNQYLGSKTSDPTVNNTGGALVAGNLYWNSTANEMRVYTGSAWLAAYIPATGYLQLSGGTMTGAITFASAQTFDGAKVTGNISGNAATATSATTATNLSGGTVSGTTGAFSSTLSVTGTATLADNLTLSGSAKRITGDFSNATVGNRVVIQSSTMNGNTAVTIMPNGTAVNSSFFATNSSDPNNASTALMRVNASEMALISGITGTGTYLPMVFLTNNTERGRITTGGNWLIGSSTDNGTDKLQVTGSMSLSSALRVGATPSAGTAGQVLTSAGAGAAPTWATAQGVISSYQEFLSSGTWTKPAGATWVYVEAIGGGGGGRSGAFSGNNVQGGGGGEFTSQLMRAADVAATVTVTVGAGGAGGPVGGDNGSNGGSSTFGSLVTARGGQGGRTGAANTAYTGLPGGPTGTSIDNVGGAIYPQAGPGGAPGAPGISTIYGGAGGGGCNGSNTNGGTSVYGGNGGNAVASGAGQNGAQPGGGGGANNSGSFKAGDGGAGRVRVWAW